MKFDIVKTIVAIAVASLAAYGLYTWNIAENKWLLPVVSFIEISLFMVSAIGIKVEWVRSMANIKIVSWLFVVVGLIMNIIFSKTDFSIPAFIISNGGIILLFVILIYSLLRANKA